MHATGQTMVIRVPISKEVFEYPAAIKLPPGTAASQLTPYSLTSSLPIHDRFDFKTFTAPASNAARLVQGNLRLVTHQSIKRSMAFCYLKLILVSRSFGFGQISASSSLGHLPEYPVLHFFTQLL